MELHQVRYFLALARTLNFTRAAELSNVTQPALTKAIQKLEQELGGALIYRERHHTQLTDLGALILPMLEQSVAFADTARFRAKEYQDKEIAPLRIGLAPTVSAAIIVDPLVELARFVPGLEIDILERAPEQMADALLDGEVHAGIVGVSDAVSERVNQWALFTERYMVVSCRYHPFAELTVLRLSDLKAAVWLERVGCEVWEQFQRICFAPSEMRIGHRGRQESHLQSMAAAGLGVMLAPEHAPMLPGLVARPIENDPIQREVQLMVMAGRRYSPALDAFIKVARQKDWHANIVTDRPAPHAVEVSE
jgi:DNA-binding transcriptional LysR family regulator